VTNSKVAKESIDEYLKMKGEKPYIQYVDGKQVNRIHSEDSILYNASQNMAKFVQENMSENKKSTLMNTVKNAATNIKESFKDTMNDMHQYSEEK
jgi:siroheme synthase